MVSIFCTGYHIAVLHLWGDDAASPVHSLHFAYGLGAVIGPQIAWPFLAERAEDNSTTISPYSTPSWLQNTTKLYTEAASDWTTEPPKDDASRVEIPFMISGIFGLSLAICFLLFYLKGEPEGLPQRKEAPLSLAMCSPSACGRGQPIKALMIIGAMCLFYFHLVGAEATVGIYLFSYLTEKKNPFDNAEAAFLNSAYFASYTAGRGVGILFGKILQPSKMLFAYSIACIVICIVLGIFAYDSDTILWIFIILLGVGHSVLYPGGIAFANQYLNINAMGLFVFTLGSVAGSALYPFLCGLFFNDNKYKAFTYILLLTAVIRFIFYVIALIIAIITKGEHMDDEKTNSEDMFQITKF